ncbi:uncharacterized protein LOC122498870 isoform X3 [Leptopilina heterotoma]|uniref:uncharacterized protein LOC122498870 isoform X3 n=1 Tax=Leptopilina heterotoma TaxID=63436 RepID=UPI001CA88961|nr:uncharacterized protein LOC122498870 isoform X3 [Leptopilina heterotoma]
MSEEKNVLQYNDEYFARDFLALCKIYFWSEENEKKNINLSNSEHLKVIREQAFGLTGAVTEATLQSLGCFLRNNTGLDLHTTDLLSHSPLLCGRYLLVYYYAKHPNVKAKSIGNIGVSTVDKFLEWLLRDFLDGESEHEDILADHLRSLYRIGKTNNLLTLKYIAENRITIGELESATRTFLNYFLFTFYELYSFEEEHAHYAIKEEIVFPDESPINMVPGLPEPLPVEVSREPRDFRTLVNELDQAGRQRYISSKRGKEPSPPTAPRKKRGLEDGHSFLATVWCKCSTSLQGRI